MSHVVLSGHEHMIYFPSINTSFLQPSANADSQSMNIPFVDSHFDLKLSNSEVEQLEIRINNIINKTFFI